MNAHRDEPVRPTVPPEAPAADPRTIYAACRAVGLGRARALWITVKMLAAA